VPKEMTLTVVGLNYRLTISTMEDLAHDVPLHCRLEREPSNSHDGNAIKVLVTEKPWAKKHEPLHIGYLSRVVASEIAPRMDAFKWPKYDVWLIEVDDDSATGQLRLKPVGK
jgi:hypothetical protein